MQQPYPSAARAAHPRRRALTSAALTLLLALLLPWAARAQAPTITGLNPTGGAVGSTFVVSGTNLTGTTSVLLGGQPAAFSSVTATSLTVTVPPGASTHYVLLTTPAGRALSSAAFQVSRPSPRPEFAAAALSGVPAVGSLAIPTVTDLDGDGLLDLLVGNNAGNTQRFEQTTASGTAFAAALSGMPDVGDSAAPTVTDLDGDGLLDLLVGNYAGDTQRFEQTTAGGSAFAPATLSGVPNVGTYAAPTVTDLDGDGLLDLLVGNNIGNTQRFEQLLPPAPTLSNLNPNAGPVGTVVTLTGTDLTGATAVSFNGTAALTFSVSNATTATATVPTGATTGNVTVTTPGGTSNGVSFTVTVPPTITGLNPTGGAVGSTFVVSGTNLTGTTSVLLGGQPAAFGNVTATSLTVTVPPGASTHKVQVTTPAGRALSSAAFQVSRPSPRPEFAAAALSGVPNVGTYAAPTVTDLDGDGLLDLLVGNNAGNTQRFEQTTAGGTAFAAALSGVPGVGNYAAPTVTDLDGDGLLDLLVGNLDGNTQRFEQLPPAPTLSSLNPNAGPVGTVVTLTGTDLTGATGVSFNGTAALTFSVSNATTATATVPAGATTGNVTITTPGGTSNGVAFVVVVVPTVTTATPGSIAPTSAVLGGSVTTDGGAAVTGRGIVYSITSTNATPIIGGAGVTAVANGTGTGAFSATIAGLASGTAYSVQAYATNSAGTNYGGVQTFTTPAATATVVSITRLTPSPTATAEVSYQVVFSASVTGVTASNFFPTITSGSISGASVASVGGAGTTRTVVVNTGTGNGSLRLEVTNSTGISPTVTNVPYTIGEQYGIVKSFAAAPLLTLRGTGSPNFTDVTAFVDLVQVVQNGTSTTVAGSLQNVSFETNNLPAAAGSFLYGPAAGASPWTLGTQAGLSRNGTTNFSSTAADGTAVALLQNGGPNSSLAQNLAVPTGSYQVSFQARQRANNGPSDQVVNVFLNDGTNDVFVGSIAPGTSYQNFTSAAFSVTAPALTSTVSTTSASPTSTSPIPFAVSFSQSVGTTFTATDVTVTGGTLTAGSFAGSGAGPYTFTVTPTGSGTVTVSLAAGVANDANNTFNSASNAVSVQYQQPATAAPAITAPANNSFTNQAVTISGTAPANSTVTLYLSRNGGAPSPTVLTAQAGGTFSTGPLPLADGTYQVYATAQSNGASVSANSATTTFTVDTTPATVALTSTSGTSGSTNVAAPFLFTATFSEGVSGFVAGDISVTNGSVTSGPTVVGGTTPANSTYTFTVTPATAGTVTSVFVFTNSVQDAAGNGNTASNTYALTSAPPVVTVSPTNGTLPGGTVGTAYSQTFTASGATAPYTYAITAGALPAGLTLSSAGVLSGTPTASGPFGFTVRATDASATPGPYSGARAYTLAIAAPAAVTWTGNNSSDWFTAGNWTPAVVPTTAINATIPAAPSGGRFPALTTAASTANVRNLSINSGALLSQTDGTLALAGNLTNNGTFQPTGGTVELGGTALGTILGAGNTRFWNLTVQANGARSGTSAGTSVQRVLTLNGNFDTNGNPFTLASNATGTALVVNNGSNVVAGTVTVQRYIDPSLNAGAGYRHYSAPVSNSTVGDLATAGFTPTLTPAYNTSPTPSLVTSFPTVYGYDQNRLATANNNLSFFDKGWFSPAALSDPLVVGQGYTVNLDASQLVDFTGTLNNGTVTQTLASNRSTFPDGGWQLVGNPYPAPLDYSQIIPADRINLDGAMYVFSSTSQYGGQYRSFTNGIGGNAVIPSGQGFFMRVAAGQPSATLTFRNSQRLTSPDATTFQRTTADTRPLVQLRLRGATGTLSDDAYMYAEAGATPGVDAQYDAVKLPNSNGLNLSMAAAGQELAINGLPAFTAGTTVPLSVGVPAAGPYALHVTQLLNLPAGTAAVLVDAQLGTRTDLATLPAAGYAFTVTATQATALLTGRFFLNLSAAGPLATAAGRAAATLQLYPNPTHGAATLTGALPGTAVTVYDALGRQVAAATADAAGTVALALPASLPAGVYVVRAGSRAMKLTVE